jgi:hypothetical protein
MNYDGPAQVNAISPNAEYHGEDKVLTVDLRLELLADSEMLEEFAPGLQAVCFDHKGMRLLPTLGAIPFADKYERMELTIGEATYKGVVLDKFKLECEQGGVVRVGCTARIESDHSDISALHQLLREQVRVQLSQQQGELEL